MLTSTLPRFLILTPSPCHPVDLLNIIDAVAAEAEAGRVAVGLPDIWPADGTELVDTSNCLLG